MIGWTAYSRGRAKMDMAKMNDWLTVITNIGVIAGLVLLAYEISQTNEAIELDSVALQAQTASNINGRSTR